MLMKTSLRLRLLVLILVPLLVAAALGQAWQYRKSAQLAENVFDQKLSIMALAIYRDLFVTNGEQLSPATKALFEEASDSTIFLSCQRARWRLCDRLFAAAPAPA